VGELRVRVLGGFEIEGIDPALFGSRKARTLVKALALARGRAVTTDTLADWIWPDGPPTRPAEQVRVLVSRLRSVTGTDRLPRTEVGYALRLDWLDLDAMSELVEEARRRMATGSPGLARAAAQAALALSRGPLLPEEPDAEWTHADRALALRLEAEARQIGAEAALSAGDVSGAAALAQGALELDPYDEAVVRTLMRALSLSGRPASALATYAAFRSLLSEELGVSPTEETEALHTSILLTPPAASPRPTTMATAPVLPGRAEAWNALDQALAAAAAGQGGLVVVTGEGGIGKTRLLTDWSANARERGATVVSGQCEELGRGLPLQAVLDGLDVHLRQIGPEAAHELLGPNREFLGPLLAGGPTSPVTALPSALLEQMNGQLVLFAAVVNVFSRMPPPTVVLVDDCHLAGLSTIEWLHYAARRCVGLPILIVCAQRPEEAAALPARTTIGLGPLDEDAAADVVGAVRAKELLARSGGNPLFLVELAAADPTEGLPNTIRDAIKARASRAGNEVVATLRTAAVLGSTVDLDLLSAVLRVSPVKLLGHLEQGVRFGLLVDDATGFTFRHDLIREAFELDTGASRWALAHREAGRVLAARVNADPLVVAHHARLGGDHELAGRALVDAATVASGRFDQQQARRLLDESLGLDDSLRARLLRARVLIMLGNYQGASGDIDAAIDRGGGAAALELGAWAAHYQRDFARALRLADQGAGLAATPDEKAGCLVIGGWVCQCTGDLPEAERRLTEADQLHPTRWTPLSKVWLGGLRVHQGRCAEGLELIRPAVSSTNIPVLPSQPALHAHLFAALGLANLGRVTEALAELAALDTEETRTGAVRWGGRADNTRGWVLRGLGDWVAADEANARGLERATSIGMREPMSHSHLDLAAGALVAADWERAQAEVDAADALGQAHALAWRHALRGQLYRGELSLARGDIESAHEIGGAVRTRAEAIGTARYRTLAELLIARTRLAGGLPVDLDVVDGLLLGLGNLASMEAWRLTAMLASAAGVERWWKLAEDRVAALLPHAGPHAETLQRSAGTTLTRIRTAGRKG